MSEIKKINILNIIVDSFITLVVFIVNYFLQFNKNGFTFATFMLSIVGVINLIFICIKEAAVVTYDTKRYTLILHVAHILLGVILHYIAKYVSGYYNIQILYWGLLVVLIATPIIVIQYLNYCEEKDKKSNSNTPKFIMNK